MPEFLAPTPDPLTEPFWDAARERRLVLQRCTPCQVFQFPPLPSCRSCGGDLEWVPSPGTGRLYTWTVVRRSTHTVLASWVPYVLALGRLDEGVTLCAHLLDVDPDAVPADLAITVGFERVGEHAVPVFRPTARALAS